MERQDILIRALCDPARSPLPGGAVELVETHISWVLLCGAYAYKIKKAVDLGFLDFSTLGKRRFCCEEELRLNRRLAPDLYLDVLAIGGTPHAPLLGGTPAIEYAVRMARFPQAALLDRQLAAGLLSPKHIDAVASEVARFHGAIASLPAPPGLGTALAVHQPVRDNFDQLAACDLPDPALTGRLRQWSEEEFTRRHDDFSSRRDAGFVRECHGDLHLGNMAWLDDRPVLFDCIEFNPALRWVDVMSDAAFVIMDLHDRNQPHLARRFLSAYLDQSGDFDGLRVLPYYLAYRAAVRAKVACIRAGQTGVDDAQQHSAREQAQAYLALASHLIRPAPLFLMITHGFSGSGKTTVTQYLVEHSSAIRVRSDVERKRLFGLAPQESSQSGLNTGIYTPDAHQQTYQHLEQVARAVLQAGYPVIIDAAFLKRAERMAFQHLADSLNVPFIILHLQADVATLRQRITNRQAEGRDASEATLNVLDLQLQGSEGLTGEETALTCVLDTEYPDAAGTVLQTLANQLMDNPDKICQG